MSYKDVYFRQDYAKLYCMDGDEVVEYNYESVSGNVTYTFVLRPIDQELDGKKYYDIISPYGYGGPILYNITDEEALIEEFSRDFEAFCAKGSIVTEFVRFHPLIENYRWSQGRMEVIYNRKTIYIDLEDEDLIWKNMKSASRNRIRKAQDMGITVEVDPQGETIERFIELYYMTMDKNDANTMYYFDKAYFTSMINNKMGLILNAILDGVIISSLFVLTGDQYMHYHLGATNPEFYSLSPNNILFYEAACWGLKNGYSKFHLGGGYKAPDDGIFRFKKTLNTKGEVDFHIGKKIHDLQVYDQLCVGRGDDQVADAGFFPRYRAPLKAE